MMATGSNLSSPTEGKIRFLQISQLLLDVGTSVLRRLLLSCIQKEDNVTLNDFLLEQEKTIRQLVKRGFLQKTQLSIIYPGDTPSVDLKDWDISICSCILINCCTLNRSNKTSVEEIRDTRNRVLAHRENASLTVHEFQTTWKNIEGAINTLVGSIGDPVFSMNTSEQTQAIQNSTTQDKLQINQVLYDRSKRLEKESQKHNEGLADVQEFLLNTYSSLTNFHILGKGVQVSNLYVDATVYCCKDSWLFGNDEEAERLKDYEQMFSGAFRNVYLVGYPGMGKTAFCLRLVETWANALRRHSANLHLTDGQEYLAKRFDLVLFVRLGATKKNVVADMLKTELFLENPQLFNCVEFYIRERPDRVLIILDGLDEWQSDPEQQFPKRDQLNHCLIFTTTRHAVFDKLNVDASDRLFEIRKLSEENVKVLARNVLQFVYDADQPSKKASLFLSVLRRKRLYLVTDVPIILAFLVGLWYENEEFGHSKTAVYCHLLNHILSFGFTRHLKQHANRLNQLVLDEDCLHIKTHYDLVLDVGEFAYDCLLNDKVSKLSSKSYLEELFGKENTKYCLASGLLTVLPKPCVSNPQKVHVVFFHRTIQDFLAAFFISFMIHNKSDDHLNKLLQYADTTEKIKDLRNVITFLCGLASEKSHKISLHLAETFSDSSDVENYRRGLDDRYRFSNKSYKVMKAIQKLQLVCYLESEFNKNKHVHNFVMNDIVVEDKIDENLKTLMVQNKFLLKSLYIDLPNRLVTQDIKDLILETTSLVRLRLDRSASEILYELDPRHFRSLHSLTASIHDHHLLPMLLLELKMLRFLSLDLQGGHALFQDLQMFFDQSLSLEELELNKVCVDTLSCRQLCRMPVNLTKLVDLKRIRLDDVYSCCTTIPLTSVLRELEITGLVYNPSSILCCVSDQYLTTLTLGHLGANYRWNEEDYLTIERLLSNITSLRYLRLMGIINIYTHIRICKDAKEIKAIRLDSVTLTKPGAWETFLESVHECTSQCEIFILEPGYYNVPESFLKERFYDVRLSKNSYIFKQRQRV